MITIAQILIGVGILGLAYILYHLFKRNDDDNFNAGMLIA